ASVSRGESRGKPLALAIHALSCRFHLGQAFLYGLDLGLHVFQILLEPGDALLSRGEVSPETALAATAAAPTMMAMLLTTSTHRTHLLSLLLKVRFILF
ncbi:MAG: hypothetical protein ABIN58_11780, partial [candidate division WOR-3 bacterium]